MQVTFVIAIHGQMFFDVLEHFAGLDDFPVVPAVFLGQLGRMNVEIGLAQELLERPAHELAETLVGEDEPPLEVLAEDVARQAFDQRVIECFRFAQRQFSALRRSNSCQPWTATASSPAAACRSLGRLASACRHTASSAAGTSGHSRRGGAGASC